MNAMSCVYLPMCGLTENKVVFFARVPVQRDKARAKERVEIVSTDSVVHFL